MSSKKALERIETMFPFNKEYKSNYYSQFSSSVEPFYKDFNLIKQDLERLEKLEKDIKEYRKAIKSWDETAGNLLKENIKLKKIIEVLKEAVDEIEFITCDEEDCYGELCLYQKINGSISIPLKTKEEYILAKEVLSNER